MAGQLPVRLHALGHFDAEQLHAQLYDLGHLLRHHEAEQALLLVAFAKNLEVVIELVVFLHQLIAIVGHGAGVVVAACILYHCGKVADVLHNVFLLGRYGHVGLQSFGSGVNALLGCLAQNGTYAGIGVLYEWARVAVEIDAFFGIEEHVLSGIHLQQEIL